MSHRTSAAVATARAVLIAALLVVLIGCGGTVSTPPTGPPATSSPAVESLRFTVVAQHPHDPSSFTEGLVFVDESTLAESSGQYGQSDVRLVEVMTGSIMRRSLLDPSQFAEGLALRQGTLTQLTWRERVVLRWSTTDLASQPGATLEAEGWGLTYNPADDSFLSSDGTSRISVRDPDTMAERRSFVVRRDGTEIRKLNELEFVDGQLWANVWQTAEILRIDPTTGSVTGVLDCTLLDPQLGDPEAVLNGIAHRPGDPPNRLWVTGKRWPTLFEIDVTGSP